MLLYILLRNRYVKETPHTIQIYSWILGLKPLSSKSFISLGDSVSDYEMARYFAEQSLPSTFVYVGKPTDKIRHDEGGVFVV